MERGLRLPIVLALAALFILAAGCATVKVDPSSELLVRMAGRNVAVELGRRAPETALAIKAPAEAVLLADDINEALPGLTEALLAASAEMEEDPVMQLNIRDLCSMLEVNADRPEVIRAIAGGYIEGLALI